MNSQEKNSIRGRKYTINQHYFDSIDTEEKAYFLGFLYADGHNSKSSVTLALKEDDKPILELFQTLINSNCPLKFRNNEKDRLNGENRKDQWILTLYNYHLSQALNNLGMIGDKTFSLTFPNENKIPPLLLRHFIRGFFDGDGWVNENGKSICIVSTLEFCNDLNKVFEKELGVSCYIRARHPKKNNNIRMLEKKGRIAIKTILKYLYDDCTISLDRKHTLYLKHSKTTSIREQKRIQRKENASL